MSTNRYGSRLTRRQVIAGASAAVAATVLAACAPAPTATTAPTPTTAPAAGATAVSTSAAPTAAPKAATTATVATQAAASGQAVTLSAHFTFSPTYKPRIEEWTQKFQEKNPSQKVDLVFEPWGEWQTKILTMTAAHTMPELVAVHVSRAQILIAQGALLDLTDVVKADSDFAVDDFTKVSLDMMSSKGRIYGFPWDYGSPVLAYNKDLFDKAKLPYPTDQWTMDDLRTAAKALTNSADKAFGFDSVPGPQADESFLGPWGAAQVDEQETKCLLNSPEAQKALQFWVDMRLVDKSIPMPADQEAMKALGAVPFQTGKIAMTKEYPWDAGETSKFAKFKWDVAPWPKGPAKRSATGNGSGYAVGKDTKYQDQAWTYIRWFASKEGQAYLFGVDATSLPSRQSAQPLFLKADGTPAHGQYWLDALKEYTTTMRPRSAAAPEYVTIAQREYDLMLLGKKSVKDATDAIVKDATPVLAKNLG